MTSLWKLVTVSHVRRVKTDNLQPVKCKMTWGENVLLHTQDPCKYYVTESLGSRTLGSLKNVITSVIRDDFTNWEIIKRTSTDNPYREGGFLATVDEGDPEGSTGEEKVTYRIKEKIALTI